MSEVQQVVATVKRLLRARGLTYRDVARALDLLEASVKRVFAGERFTVDRLARVAALLGCTLAELMQEAASGAPVLHALDRSQEARLVADEKLLLVAVCALNHWGLDDIVATYRLTRAEALQRLLGLERLGMLALLPGDRVRLRVARDFDWLPDGPIRQWFQSWGLPDFLAGPFEPEAMQFVHGMLTPAARAELHRELRRLRQRLAALHDESAVLPRAQRSGTALLLAVREWEPKAFDRLRRPR